MISKEKDFNQIAVPYLYLCIYLLLHIAAAYLFLDLVLDQGAVTGLPFPEPVHVCKAEEKDSARGRF